jgi:hypothetical protein
MVMGRSPARVLRVHRESYGTGAGDVVVHELDEKVLSMRSAFQQVIEPTFTAIIERGTGRRVSSFLSTTHLDPSYSVELFRLRPALA